MNESALVCSLFPGIGLLDRAFEEEGFTVVRGPDLLWGGDIRQFHLPTGRFDGVIGGPPCPDFSPLRYLIAAHGYNSRHGNLIPEFERVVSEAQPGWFLMEAGPFAPDASIGGYASFGFYLCPTWIGEEQMRKRKFCFGVKGAERIDLRQWVDYAIFKPMTPQGTVYTENVYNCPVPVAIGGSGKPKVRRAAVICSGQPTFEDGGRVKRLPRRSLEECCILQGLPPDFLKDSPFTMTAKREMIGNGVQFTVGLAVARAIKRAMGYTWEAP